MKVGSEISCALPVHKGVPQGSVLGPLLFNMMVNDMLVAHDDTHSFSDDTMLLFSHPSLSESLQHASTLTTVAL